jgi:nitrite reductase/ring-hydroxylating ferredoxin subunit
MGTLIEICALEDLRPGSVRNHELPDAPPLAIYNIGGRIFCTDDLCTHGNARLSDGDIDGMDIICPFHDGSFDIETGRPTGSPCIIPLKTHPVEIIDGQIVVMMT